MTETSLNKKEDWEWFKPLNIPYEHVDVNGRPLSLMTASQDLYDTITNMEITEKDTFLGSFPKSGTTWLLHVVHYINYHGNPPPEKVVDDFIPWIDCDPYSIEPPGNKRFFKTHVPFSWLPYDSGAKYIYVVRNSKDVAISFYYFLEGLLRKFIPSVNEILIEDYIDLFLEGKVLYGSWWSHVLEWDTASRSHGNILILSYEDMSRDLRCEVLKIAQFLGQDLTETEADTIAEKCTFGQMKKDSSSSMGYVKNFMRKGICGDYINYFTEEQIKLFDDKNVSLLPGDLLNKLTA